MIHLDKAKRYWRMCVSIWESNGAPLTYISGIDEEIHPIHVGSKIVVVFFSVLL